MQRLNAIDAIAPAFTRTHEILFHPFRLGRSWKLAATSYAATMGSVFLPLPLIFLLPMHAMPNDHAGTGRALLGAFAAVFSLIFLGAFYLGVRLSFVEFEMLVTRAKLVAPMWNHYGIRVWPWVWLKVAVGSVLTAILLPILWVRGPILLSALASMPRPVPGQPPDPLAVERMMHGILPVYAVLFGCFLLFKFVSTLLDDFVLPFYILENISLSAALGRGADVVLADPVHVVVYVVLKYILAGIGFFMQYLANIVCMIPAFIILIVGAVLGVVTLGHGGGPQRTLLAVAAAIVGYGLFFAYAMYLGVAMFGYLLQVLDAYAIFFLAGRYPLLGDLLEPGPDHPFTPPPSYPSSDEEDGGPPLPMDPALA